MQLVFDIASEYGLPFRFPSRYTPEQIARFGPKIDESLIQMLFSKFRDYADHKGVAIPDYLIAHEWDGPQSDSYENFREYMFEHFKTFPDGVSETFIHPSLESDELKGTSGVWYRRVWEHRLFADPATKEYLEGLGFKYINYRDLAAMRAK